jgi:hypothetical protein
MHRVDFVSADDRRGCTMKRSKNIFVTAVTLACFALAPMASAASSTSRPEAVSPVGWLWLSSTQSARCTYTAVVDWGDWGSRPKTLEVFVTETYTGAPLVPARVRINASTTTATVTLAPLARSKTERHFYVWAQLLNRKGVAIPGSLDFSSDSTARCKG